MLPDRIWSFFAFLMVPPLAQAAVAPNASSNREAAAAKIECFAASDMVRVFEDGFGEQKERKREIELFGLRNETISAQCVIVAGAALNNVRVSVGPLTRADGPDSITAKNVTWNFVESIFLEKNTPNRRAGGVTRPAPAWFPDCLSTERECSIAAGARKAVYLTIKIPKETPPGDYRCQVTCSSGDDSVRLPISLRVYPLSLPEARHVMATEWYSTSQFAKHGDLKPSDEEAFFRMLRAYADNMAEHRQNVFQVSMGLIEGSRSSSDGTLAFDFGRFDKWAQVFWNTGRMDLLETGFVAHFGEGGWSSKEILLRDYSVREGHSGRTSRVAGEEYLRHFLPAFVRHLREKGWLEKTLFHICDEPSAHNVLSWRKASEFVRRHAPELRRIDAIETPHCAGELEILVPKLDHLATWYDAYDEARRKGGELWFYTVGIFQNGDLPNKTVDVPLLESRLMHWINYRFGLRGYLHWGFNAWTDDPIKSPGKHCGDGWHVYPGPDGLLNSLRWEQMRNGLQDFECLWLLEQKITELKGRMGGRVGDMITPSRRGEEIASRVIRTMHDRTEDPAVLLGARRQAIEETLGLAESPQAVVETEPREHSMVGRGCAIDVHGWVEAGTIVKINGRTVDVEPDGLFVHQTPPSKEGTVAVELQRGDARKGIVRQFRSAP